jgi:hypothetical protein
MTPLDHESPNGLAGFCEGLEDGVQVDGMPNPLGQCRQELCRWEGRESHGWRGRT